MFHFYEFPLCVETETVRYAVSRLWTMYDEYIVQRVHHYAGVIMYIVFLLYRAAEAVVCVNHVIVANVLSTFWCNKRKLSMPESQLLREKLIHNNTRVL